MQSNTIQLTIPMILMSLLGMGWNEPFHPSYWTMKTGPGRSEYDEDDEEDEQLAKYLDEHDLELDEEED